MQAKGFTLVELLVTISVIGILSAIAIPSFNGMLARQRIKSAAAELQMTFAQARSLAASSGRVVEVWPAYANSANPWNGGANDSAPNSSIRLPNASEVLKSQLIAARLSWYLVAPGATTTAGGASVASSTTNVYPVQVDLKDSVQITSTASVTGGVRFWPDGHITQTNAANTAIVGQVNFRVCDSKISKEDGYTVILNSFGTTRSVFGPAGDSVGMATCT